MDDDLVIHIEQRTPVRDRDVLKENRSLAPSFVAKRFDPSAPVKKSKKRNREDGVAPESKKHRVPVAPALEPSPGAATGSSALCESPKNRTVDRSDTPNDGVVKNDSTNKTMKAKGKKVHGDGAFDRKKTRVATTDDAAPRRESMLCMDEFGSGDVVVKKNVSSMVDKTQGTTGDGNVKTGEGKMKGKKKRRGAGKLAPEVVASAGPVVHIVSQESVFSERSFESLEGLVPQLIRQLKYREFTTMTDVQSKAIPATLGGNDALIKAPTGSGKTLAFLVPLINQIVTQGPSERSNGTVALVLSPTKELCMQSHQVCMKLTTMLPWLVSGQISGGENPKSEKARLRKGVHILFATPGRLTYHMDNSNGWKVATNLCCFVMDEADRLLDLGFEKQVKQIYQKIVQPRGAQTLLVSATLTEAVKKLGDFCLKKDHTFVGGQGEESDQWTIPGSLNQWCVELPAKKRLAGLVALLLEKKSKSIVFFSSCAEVDFHYDLFQEIRWPDLHAKKDAKPETKLRDVGKGFVGIDVRQDEDVDMEERSDRPRIFSELKVFKLHGDLKAEERNGFIADFAKAEHGVLLASDVVARGIDLPSLNWIIQYDPPRQIEEYLHRVGRAARLGRAGESCLFLQPQEMAYVDVLKDKGVSMKRIDGIALCDNLRQNLPRQDPLLRVRDLASFVSSSIAKHVEARPLLLQVARKAFWSWMRGYQTFPRDLKPIFNYRTLHTGHIAAAFALNEAPTKVFSGLKRDATSQEKGKGKGSARKPKLRKHSTVDEFAM